MSHILTYDQSNAQKLSDKLAFYNSLTPNERIGIAEHELREIKIKPQDDYEYKTTDADFRIFNTAIDVACKIFAVSRNSVVLKTNHTYEARAAAIYLIEAHSNIPIVKIAHLFQYVTGQSVREIMQRKSELLMKKRFEISFRLAEHEFASRYAELCVA